jgi:hypothetical protein
MTINSILLGFMSFTFIDDCLEDQENICKNFFEKQQKHLHAERSPPPLFESKNNCL